MDNVNSADIQTQFQSIASTFIGEWGWLFIVGLIVLMFRTAIENCLASIVFFFGNDFNVDDVLIWENKPVRVVRKGIFKTVFFIYVIKDHTIIRETKMVVSNSNLKNLKIEKPLPDLRINELFYSNNNNGNGNNNGGKH